MKAYLGNVFGNVTIGTKSTDPSCTVGYLSYYTNLDIEMLIYCVDD